MRLTVGTVMLQWAAGGMLFTWVTTYRREVSLGYGWTSRITFGSIAAIGLAAGLGSAVARAGVGGLIAGAALALTVSWVRRGAGVSGIEERRRARRARVAGMLAGGDTSAGETSGRTGTGARSPEVPAPGLAASGRLGSPGSARKEYPPALDLVAALAGLVGVLGAAADADGPYLLTAARFGAGALLLGAVSAAMLLGHWYLVQPGLGRGPLRNLVILTAAVWPAHLVAFLVPTGMLQVLSGTVDDGYGGLLGWVWLNCAASTLGLLGLTWLALRERYYSAVMSATGLLYLALLTGFGMDLVARAVLAL